MQLACVCVCVCVYHSHNAISTMFELFDLPLGTNPSENAPDAELEAELMLAQLIIVIVASICLSAVIAAVCVIVGCTWCMFKRHRAGMLNVASD